MTATQRPSTAVPIIVPDLGDDLDTLPPKSSTNDCKSPYGTSEPEPIRWPAGDRAAVLEAIFASAADIVFVFDRAGKLLDINPAGCVLACANLPEEVRGQFVDR